MLGLEMGYTLSRIALRKQALAGFEAQATASSTVSMMQALLQNGGWPSWGSGLWQRANEWQHAASVSHAAPRASVGWHL